MQLPKFDNPPVVETVLSAQFSRLQNFSSVHAGSFWQLHLNKNGSWPKISQAPRLPDQFERFEDGAGWSQFPFSIQMGPERIQIISRDEQRMVQIQDSRFVLNWRKQGNSAYPSYQVLRPEFDQHFADFQSFIKQYEQNSLDVNQWEITYVNSIDKKILWNKVDEWNRIVPSVALPKTPAASSETAQFDWRYRLHKDRGRIYVTISHGRIGSPGGQESLLIQIVARGPVTKESGWSLAEGFDLGHEAIVSTFESITSSEAHKVWSKKG